MHVYASIGCVIGVLCVLVVCAVSGCGVLSGVCGIVCLVAVLCVVVCDYWNV